MTLDEKIAQAEKALQLGAEMSELYYKAPLIITYSGGKDSDVMLDIALHCLQPEQFEVINSHTTVDAPETVYYIRDKFKELAAAGIMTEIHMPRYKGQPTSMWKLIELKGVPSRRVRFCCSILKENTAPNRMIAVGVREDESKAREGRDMFFLQGKTKEEAKYATLDHIAEQFASSKEVSAQMGSVADPNAYDCKFIEEAKNNKDIIISPIYKFTEADIWEYIRMRRLCVNPLYAKGYTRVGCVGCPLAGKNKIRKEFADYPKYRENYVKAFDRMLTRLRKRGKEFMSCSTGEEVMRWYVGEDPKQVRIEDIVKEADNEDRG